MIYEMADDAGDAQLQPSSASPFPCHTSNLTIVTAAKVQHRCQNCPPLNSGGVSKLVLTGWRADGCGGHSTAL